MLQQTESSKTLAMFVLAVESTCLKDLSHCTLY